MFVRMRLVKEMSVEKTRPNQLARTKSRIQRGRLFSDNIYLEARFFARLAQYGFVWILIKLDMSSDLQPDAELFMHMEQYFITVHDVRACSEIYFFVDMCHTISCKVRPLGFEPRTLEV